ncbi:MAG: sporulation protein YqfD, partial [Clostridia bacterium]|nr:sporulation protein YqfD [Clostridia bacterium]
IELFSIRKTGNKTLVLRVKQRDFAKFFAITRELCYNVKIKGASGKFYMPYYLIKNFGIIIGAAVFIFCSFLFNDIIMDYSFAGTGSIYKDEIVSFLEEKGVRKYSRFSDTDLKTLGDELLANFDGLSFASCEKRGNRLYCDLVLSAEKKDVISGNFPDLFSEYDGVISDIKVYRGTAKVKVGDAVKNGDLLVSGSQTVRDTVLKVSVIARAVILSEYKEEYLSFFEGEGEYAKELVKEKFGKEIENASVTERKDKDKVVYTVTLTYKNVIFAG